MRVARQHPLHLQVTRTNNGKFVVNQNGSNIRDQAVAGQDERRGEVQEEYLRRQEQNNQNQNQNQNQNRQQTTHPLDYRRLHRHRRRRRNHRLHEQQRRLDDRQIQNQRQQQEQQEQQLRQLLHQRRHGQRSRYEERDERMPNESVARQTDIAATDPAVNDEETADVSTAAFDNSESNPPAAASDHRPALLGDRFLLVGPAEGSALYRCVDVKTGQQLVAKGLTVDDNGGRALLEAHLRLEGTGAAGGVAGVVDAPGGRRYLLLEGHHGDLHAYVRARRRLREPEARRLFGQAAQAVSTCHENGVVLRDLKLRKFVFADEARTKLRLESLEDAVIVEENDDRLADRRGCPAYVAPEVLRSGRAYSGKAADIWSLGILLYTMLVGRYPFNDAEHASLFAKISRGQFTVPDGLSPRAKCLVKALLRKEPAERPHGQDVVRHPWLARPLNFPQTAARSHDQMVPQSATNYSQD